MKSQAEISWKLINPFRVKMGNLNKAPWWVLLNKSMM